MIHAAIFNYNYEPIKICDGSKVFLDLNTNSEVGESWKPIDPEVLNLQDVPPYDQLENYSDQ